MTGDFPFRNPRGNCIQQRQRKLPWLGPSLLAPGMPRHCCYLLALLLMVFQGGQVSQVALQGFNTLLLLPVLLGFLLTFLFQIIDMFITALDLGKDMSRICLHQLFQEPEHQFFF